MLLMMKSSPEVSARPYRSPRLIALVFVGGTVGTAARAALEEAYGGGGWPWATLGINVSGAFVLGWLLEILARREARVGASPAPRLLLGTGVLGGYTTYSTFAVETLQLSLLPALLYAVLTIILGLAAAAVGFRLARGRPNEPVPEGGS